MRFALLALSALVACADAPASGPEVAAGAPEAARDTVRADWAGAFAEHGVTGTFVLQHIASGRTQRYDAARAAERFRPASTFKVYNALVALETGAVGDPDSAFVWDGVERMAPAWNRDQSLAEALPASAVWVFQDIAEAVGRERYDAAFAREPFGNGTVGDDLRLFWLDGSLRVSADEQVAFLRRLRLGEAGFRPEVQAAVRAMVPVLVERGDVRLGGKTGWGLRDGRPDLGWLVGWLEHPDGPFVYALNVEAAGPEVEVDLRTARLGVVRAILEGDGLLPRGGAE
ncbi:MAG: penicillin-binding transpeptidase domain-containing protein [Bacteroidota bacterium]